MYKVIKAFLGYLNTQDPWDAQRLILLLADKLTLAGLELLIQDLEQQRARRLFD